MLRPESLSKKLLGTLQLCIDTVVILLGALNSGQNFTKTILLHVVSYTLEWLGELLKLSLPRFYPKPVDSESLAPAFIQSLQVTPLCSHIGELLCQPVSLPECCSVACLFGQGAW